MSVAKKHTDDKTLESKAACERVLHQRIVANQGTATILGMPVRVNASAIVGERKGE